MPNLRKHFSPQGVKAAIFLCGILVGGVVFTDIEPRSILAARSCENCLNTNEIAGLLGAFAVTKTPDCCQM